MRATAMFVIEGSLIQKRLKDIRPGAIIVVSEQEMKSLRKDTMLIDIEMQPAKPVEPLPLLMFEDCTCGWKVKPGAVISVEDGIFYCPKCKKELTKKS